jgi:hypothetical protein
VVSRLWETLALVERSASELDRFYATTRDSIRQIEKHTAMVIAESRELMRNADAIIARDSWLKQEPAE